MRNPGDRIKCVYPHDTNFNSLGELIKIIGFASVFSIPYRHIWEVKLDNGKTISVNEFWLHKI